MESKPEVERLAKPVDDEAQILEGNADRREVGKEAEQVGPKGEEKMEEPKKMSMVEFSAYNSMAENMEYFVHLLRFCLTLAGMLTLVLFQHANFRRAWNLMYSACASGKRPASLSLKQFLNTGLQFCSHLSMHHAIEEQHIFPVLATKMPEFQAGKNRAELLRQHDAIHEGLEVFEAYLQDCDNGKAELDLSVLKAKMDSWGEVLWTHLDQEVKTLAAENMRRYWTVAEMRRMPM
ncbi:MAG: hypothetical protein M1818_004687 [Claussenomyces sp. TS43310]|nr:MAG: hypothetical protein M1818_004687 [Claussenomyces sp. TS43310]